MMNALVKEKELTIEELVEGIQMEAHINGTTLLKITERTNKNGLKFSCLVRTIEIEVEDLEDDELIMFIDSDNVIETNHLIVNGFLKSCVVKATKCHSDKEELDSYKIEFKDGVVDVQPLIW